MMPHSHTPPAHLAAQADTYASDPRKAALDWFRDAKFGLFVHYGLHSLLAGDWNGRQQTANLLLNTGSEADGSIPEEDMDTLRQVCKRRLGVMDSPITSPSDPPDAITFQGKGFFSIPRITRIRQATVVD